MKILIELKQELENSGNVLTKCSRQLRCSVKFASEKFHKIHRKKHVRWHPVLVKFYFLNLITFETNFIFLVIIMKETKKVFKGKMYPQNR